ncbi:MAG TPA: hypothetical protein VJS44_06100 [Pyrinomonadaceae bacterium]|nr:hypothetical protein [Pyrinomonadaceae bacterium]
MSNTSLNYIVYTTPDPLQVGPQNGTSNDPSLATLTIVVSNPKGLAASCKSIQFVFLDGTDARDFFSDSTGIGTSAPTGWNLTQDGSSFKATPDTPEDGEIGADGVVFTISKIPVNTEPGTTEMTIVEETSSGTATLSFPLAKFPQQFTVGDLKADPDTVAQGGNTTLTWSGSSGATYEIHYTDDQGNLVCITHPKDDPNENLPPAGSYEIDDLQADTTFYLRVTLSATGDDHPPTIERAFPVTVQIPPVKIVSFTGDTQYNFDQSSSSPSSVYALLTWEVTGAKQVLLNGNVVDGNSTTVPINGDTQFTLGAIGKPDPEYKTITVSGTQVTAKIYVGTARIVGADINALAGTCIFKWSVDWATDYTSGTATYSNTLPHWPGEFWQEFWQVPADMLPPDGQITAARCTITTVNEVSATPDNTSLASPGGQKADLMEAETTSGTLLSYAVQTTPDPLQASPAQGDPSLATLMIVVSNSAGHAVECQSLTFSFLEGTNARDFFADATGIGASAPTGWNLTQQGSVFTATPDTPQDGAIGADGIVFTISNIKVNQQPGTTEMVITEKTSSGTAAQTLALSKFPPQFSTGDLTANPDIVEKGQSTVLTWSGTSGATYELQYVDGDGNTVTIMQTEDGQPLPATGSYTITNLQENPTVFYLIVTMQVAGEDTPLVVKRNYPVTVTSPSVQIVSFTANPATVYGANNQVSVTISWETTAAEQVLLNNNLVAASDSTTVVINETTSFTLEATGKDGPVYSEITVTVEPVNPVFTFSHVGYNVYNYALNFGVNAGQYHVVIASYQNGTYIGELEDFPTFGSSQIVTYTQAAGPGEELVLTADGYPSGQVTASATAPDEP